VTVAHLINDTDHPPFKPSLLLEAVAKVKVEILLLPSLHTLLLEAISATGCCSGGKAGNYPPASPSLLLEASAELKLETILLPSLQYFWKLFQT
jgi:hypothetical protein